MRRALLAAGVIVAGLVAGGPAGAAPARGAADDGTVASAAAAYRRVFPQMSEAAAEDAFTQQLARKAVSREAAADSGTFGGSWFDPPTGVLHVAVTAATAGAAVEQIAGRLGVRVELHVVARSYAELQAQVSAMGGKAGIDIAANQVVPGQAATSKRELDASSCTSRLTCDSSIRAGAVLRHYGLPICSVGFTARDAEGQRYVYTAGHCDIGPGRWSTGRQVIGPVTDSERSGAVDAAIIRVDNATFADDQGGEIYEENADHSVPLDAVTSTMAEIQQGDVACLAANLTDINGPNLCGVVGSVSDPAELGMVRVDGVDACTGDSGGGWYQLASTDYRVAYGIHHDSDSGCHGDSGGSHSWFSPLPLVSAVWGLTTETQP